MAWNNRKLQFMGRLPRSKSDRRINEENGENKISRKGYPVIDDVNCADCGSEGGLNC